MGRSRRRNGIINEQKKAFRGDGYFDGYFDEVKASWVHTWIKTYQLLYFICAIYYWSIIIQWSQKKKKNTVFVSNHAQLSINCVYYSLSTGVPSQSNHQLACLVWARLSIFNIGNGFLKSMFLQNLWHTASKKELFNTLCYQTEQLWESSTYK